MSHLYRSLSLDSRLVSFPSTCDLEGMFFPLRNNARLLQVSWRSEGHMRSRFVQSRHWDRSKFVVMNANYPDKVSLACRSVHA
jgi:hypothetical protein